MTNCPPKLRGDLSKWLCEINTGVYVGNMSSRVRDALWDRVCQNLKSGSATMVYTTNNEQKMDFRVHNTTWTPVDFDGVKLMRRPRQTGDADSFLKPGFSNAYKYRAAQQRQRLRASKKDSYIVMDLETTGVHHSQDTIIEFGAIKIEDGVQTESFSRLVRCERPLPPQIVSLTGITDALLREQGIALEQALAEFLDFIGSEKLVGYNLSFDLDFLRKACKQFDQKFPSNQRIDLMSTARRKVNGVANYKLETLADHFSLPHKRLHRALEDCELQYKLYCKLNEIE